MMTISQIAKLWVKLGISVVPIRADGSKAPAISSWRNLQISPMSDGDIDTHFVDGVGIGIVAGKVSGNLEFLDFDVPKSEGGVKTGDCIFQSVLDCLDEESLKVVGTMPTVSTPGGGIHLYYRCDEVEGNQKLAMHLNPDGTAPRICTVAETRGEGGYVLAPGCPPACHPSGKVYSFTSGSFNPEESGGGIPTITGDQRSRIFSIIRSFDQSGQLERKIKKESLSRTTKPHGRSGQRPGDEYNASASWEDLLTGSGWQLAFRRSHDGAMCWVRPGKKVRGGGISATVRNIDGVELFHAFSSNSDPLPCGESITKFTAYTLLHHNGDFESAARELGRLGYGDQSRAPFTISSVIDGKRGDDVPWLDVESQGTSTSIGDPDGDSCPPDLPSEMPAHTVLPSEYDESVFYSEIDQFEDGKLKAEKKESSKKKNVEAEAQESTRVANMSKPPIYLVWRDFGAEPKKMMTSNGRIKTRADAPRSTMWTILKDEFSAENNMRVIHFQNEYFMIWKDGRYKALKLTDIQPIVSRSMTGFAEFYGEDGDQDNDDSYTPFKVRKARVAEMMSTMKDMTHLSSDILDPCWLAEPDGVDDLPDAREVVSCSNGLLDIANRRLLKPSPAFYSFNNTGIKYDTSAKKPKAWLKFLDSSLDKESQTLLQQWFGYCLVQDTRLHKMLMIFGKPGSGKGTAVSVLRSLVGESSCCAMTLDKLDSDFGLQNAIGKSLMIFPDARQNTKFDSSGTAIGSILSITGEDELQINRKHRDPITRKLNTRLVIVSNDVMQVTDRSQALSRRMLWIKFPGYKRNTDTALKNKLACELSGILNWAIEGWEMVRETGEFMTPESSAVVKEAFENQSSDIAAFLDDMCTVETHAECMKVDLVNHWNAWRVSKGYRRMGESSFGKLLAGAIMDLKIFRKRIDATRKRMYGGVGIDKSKVYEYAVEYSNSNTDDNDFISMLPGSFMSGGDIITINEYMAAKEKGEPVM